MRTLLLLLTTAWVACSPAEEIPTHVSVSGHAFDFSARGGRVEGAEVSILELPDLTTTTDADGAWAFDDLPVGSRVSFVLTGERPEVQTATFTLGTESLERVTFQAPSWDIYDLMADLARVEPDDSRCQIASTVTRRGHDMYDGSGTHGEPTSTVTITPETSAGVGPIYFNLATANLIYPDPDLTETTDDGGVLYLNVEPGEYLLEAHKRGAEFLPASITCRAGVLVNASPPWGLQVLSGGLEPRPE